MKNNDTVKRAFDLYAKIEAGRIPSDHEINYEFSQDFDDRIKSIKIPEGKTTRAGSWWRKAAAIAAVFLFMFILSVNLFPAFAKTLIKIPGLEPLVRAVMFDKSLLEAVNNDYYQKVSESKTKNGITITVDYMIVDASRISIFVKEEKPEIYKLSKAEITKEDGSEPMASVSYDLMDKEPGDFREIRIDMGEGEKIPDKIILKLIYTGDNAEDTEINFELYPDDKYAQVEKSIELNITKTIEGQTIKFHRLDIYPTQAKLLIETPEDNTAIIRNINIYFKDSGGNCYYPVKNGISATLKDDGEIKTLWYESSYFSNAEDMTMHIEGISLIDKDNLYGIIDFEKQTITNMPDDIILEKLEKNGTTVKLHFKCLSLNNVRSNDVAMFIDENGNHITRAISCHGSTEGNNIYDIYIDLDYYGGEVKVLWTYATDKKLEKEIIIGIPLSK